MKVQNVRDIRTGKTYRDVMPEIERTPSEQTGRLLSLSLPHAWRQEQAGQRAHELRPV